MERVGLVERKWEQIQQVYNLRSMNFPDFTPSPIAQSPVFRAGHIIKHFCGWVRNPFVGSCQV